MGSHVLVEIAATSMARDRFDELKSGDVSLLIRLLGKIGFSPNERGRLNFQSTAHDRSRLVTISAPFDGIQAGPGIECPQQLNQPKRTRQ
jgi:hypothetical protein